MQQSPKKILIYNPFVFQLTRGNETLALQLANELSLRNYLVHLVGFKGKNQMHVKLNDHVQISGIPYVRFFPFILAKFYLFYFIIAHKYQSVILFFPDYGCGSLINKFKKTKFILYLGYSILQSKWQFELIKRFGYPKPNLSIVGCSPEISQSTGSFLGTVIKTVLPGFDTSRFYFDEEKRTKTRNLINGREHFVILAAAAFKREKSIHKVIESIALLPEKFHIICLIAGDGEEKTNLMDLVDKLNLVDKIEFIGIRNDLENYYNAADLFIHLSESEGDVAGLTVREAMCCECLSVVYPNSTQEIEKWKPGMITLRSNEPHAVANIIKKIILNKNDNIYREIKKNGRSFIIANYSWDKTIEELESLF